MEKITYPAIGCIYQHYLGGMHEVITLATHTESNESLVIYKNLYFGDIQAMPLSMWFQNIAVEGGADVSRFVLSKIK